MGNTKELGWASVGNKKTSNFGNNGEKRHIYYKIDPKKQNKVRLVGKPIWIARYHVEGSVPGQVKTAITDKIDYDPESGRLINNECIITKKYGVEPKLRFAINLINREDGKLYVFEGGQQVFKAFREFADANGVNPGGKESVDFVITAEVPGGVKKNTKYTVTPTMKPTPFSDEEKKMIEDDMFDLEDVLRPTPQDKIEEVLYGQSSTPQKSNPQATKPQGSTPSKIDDDDLNF